jgi:predicted ferric reductase
VYLDGPYGAFTIGNPTDLHVLIAGGIGITPMMSIIRTLADRGDRRPIILLYGSKDWESITLFGSAKSAARPDNRPRARGSAAGMDGGEGLHHAEMFKRHLPQPYANHEYFICGPDVMMDAMESALKELGVPLSRYHSERYSFV